MAPVNVNIWCDLVCVKNFLRKLDATNLQESLTVANAFSFLKQNSTAFIMQNLQDLWYCDHRSKHKIKLTHRVCHHMHSVQVLSFESCKFFSVSQKKSTKIFVSYLFVVCSLTFCFLYWHTNIYFWVNICLLYNIQYEQTLNIFAQNNIKVIKEILQQNLCCIKIYNELNYNVDLFPLKLHWY